MDRSILYSSWSIGWVVPCLVVAFVLAYWMYRNSKFPWARNQNRLLGVLRFLSIFLLLILFLEPQIRSINNEVVRPKIVIGLDRSISVAERYGEEDLTSIVNDIEELQDLLQTGRDYEVIVTSLDLADETGEFDVSSTNLQQFFEEVEENYYSTNLSSVVLISDGIFNRGASPAYRTFPYPVFTVGLGDTIARRDLAITDVRNNAVAYSGNEFPVVVELDGIGFEGQSIEVRLSDESGLIESKITRIEQESAELLFLLSEEDPGSKHYTIRIDEFENELTYANNRYDLYMRVLESKKRILIRAMSPHPDIRAIRTALEVTGNYEVVLNIPGLMEPEEQENYDVEILFDGIQASGTSNRGKWIINSSESGEQLEQVSFFGVIAQGPPDNISASLNESFTKFTLTTDPQRMATYPPISVPFGQYNLSGPTETLVYQRLGSVVTEKPLLVVFDDGAEKIVVSSGTGIWQWALQETAQYGDAQLFYELVQKVVQFLSIEDEQKQFRVEPGRTDFIEGDIVFFNTEIYDEVFQLKNEQFYTIRITDESGQEVTYDFAFSDENRVARLTSMTAGSYRYRAETVIGSETLVETGEFLVNSLQLEQKTLTADHQLLRRVSAKSGGQFFNLSQWNQLSETLAETDYAGLIYSQNSNVPLAYSKWMLGVIAFLLCLEWFLRKLWGGY